MPQMLSPVMLSAVMICLALYFPLIQGAPHHLNVRYPLGFGLTNKRDVIIEGPDAQISTGYRSSAVASTTSAPISASAFGASQAAQPTATSYESEPVLVVPPDNTSPTGSHGDNSSHPLIMAYYPDWSADIFPPEKIDFTRFDWIDFAFALPTKSFDLTWDNVDEAPELLNRLVHAAHTNQCKVKLSIGGWTGSKFFSPAMATNDSRHIFAQNILAVFNQYQLDGIDIDWEYPGQQGERGNKVNATDTQNFYQLLVLLRSILPPSARITAAAQPWPFTGPDGQPLNNVTNFANILDWVLLMNYDVWGSSSNPGPNAPLYDSCNSSTQPGANAQTAFKSWTSAGFPANKIVLGLPAYGYVSKSSAEQLRTRSLISRKNHKQQPWSLESPSLNVVDEDGSGQVQFRDLVQQGALVLSSPDASEPARYIGGNGFERRWDACSGTPWLRSASSGQVITYDDPDSLAMKAEFARKSGMLGTNMFDVHGDTDEWELTSAIRHAMGLP